MGLGVRVRVKLLRSWLLCRALEFRVGLELGLGLAFDVGHLPQNIFAPGGPEADVGVQQMSSVRRQTSK